MAEYFVIVTEQTTETRRLRVEATSADQAAQIAQNAYEMGLDEGEWFGTENVGVDWDDVTIEEL